MSNASLFLTAPSINPSLLELVLQRNCTYTLITDQMPYSRKARCHRLRVGQQWLNLPLPEGIKGQRLDQIAVRNDEKFLDSSYQLLAQVYGKHTYFSHYILEFMAALEQICRQTYSIAQASLFLRSKLLRWLEWPVGTLILGSEKLENENDLNEKDPFLLAQEVQSDVKQLYQEPFSKHFQRQSIYAKQIKSIEYTSKNIAIGGIDLHATALELLFSIGSYQFQYRFPELDELFE
jgi:hypothetical protein